MSQENIQRLYKTFAEKRDQLRELGLDADYEILTTLVEEKKSAALAVWQEIAETTKSINSTLVKDVKRKPEHYMTISEKDDCWIQRQWSVRESKECTNCGNEH
jgi:predicted regulator of amino acid metabolism with ACT domain